jgi:solute carrier family 25 (mitochondrial oxoglutarate transporter), member 11
MTVSNETKNYIIGAVSGIAPLGVTLPIDYVKVQVQVLAEGHRHYRPHPLKITREILLNKGVTEFYKGLTGAVYRQLILGTVRLGLYKTLHDRAQSKSPSGTVSVSTKLSLSFICGGLAAWAASPFDLVLIRLQSERLLQSWEKRNYKGTNNAIRRILKEEGIKGCWKGSLPVILRVSTVNSISLVGYDKFKVHLDDLYGFSAIHRIYASLIASILSCIVSMPFDNLKTKLQKMVIGSDGKYPYNNLRDCIFKSIQREGIAGFYVGLPIYITRISPHVILSMLIQDFLHHYI